MELTNEPAEPGDGVRRLARSLAAGYPGRSTLESFSPRVTARGCSRRRAQSSSCGSVQSSC